ncbi:hypothetical protein GQ53DRAFT_837332 [Thozetella sp. PMI_491]|nr:hypothetical protein GQ53DRAFT_837332 [Thozetella sp. PMI_491]
MSNSTPRKLHFINTSNPTAGDARSARRLARSHSAREVHARERRLRLAKYSTDGTKEKSGDPGGHESTIPVAGQTRDAGQGAPPAPRDPEDGGASLSAPVSLLGADRRDPFASSARPLTPVEHFLVDHYVRVVVPYMNDCCYVFKYAAEYQQSAIYGWMQLALGDIGCLASILLSSCRHLVKEQPGNDKFAKMAIQYKLSCLRELNKTLAQGVPTSYDSTFAQILLLATDEMRLGDIPTTRSHVRGAIKMLELNGGPQSLGLDGFLASLYWYFLYDKGLFDTVTGPNDTERSYNLDLQEILKVAA